MIIRVTTSIQTIFISTYYGFKRCYLYLLKYYSALNFSMGINFHYTLYTTAMKIRKMYSHSINIKTYVVNSHIQSTFAPD